MIKARVAWADGAEPTHVEGQLTPFSHRRISDLAETGLGNAAIATTLNAEGLETSHA